MPEKILGKPVNESKWADAKAKAAEEGHDGDYAYVMAIYKRMAHLEKSVVDGNHYRAYNKSRDMKLVLSGADFDEFRCGGCGHLLLKGMNLHKSFIEIKCKSCGTINTN